ncbi:PEP-CTERM sorting domain-containing protein [Planctomycetota bacterium]
MKFQFIKMSVIFSLVACMFSPGLTKATPLGTVDIAHEGFYAHNLMYVWAGGWNGVIGHAGVYKLNKTSSTGEGDIWDNGAVGAFCIEWAELSSSYTYTYDVIKPSEGPLPTTYLGSAMGETKAKYLQELWGRYYDSAWVGDGPFTANQNSKAGAFATAIWEIVHEDLPVTPLGWDVTVDGTIGSGGFRGVGGDLTASNMMLHSLDGTGPLADLRVFSFDGAQDYLVAVPEPTTIVLLGLGGALSLLRRKKGLDLTNKKS